MANYGPSHFALLEAKRFVRYIEDFRTHGTGDMHRMYPDDDQNGKFEGYGNIVRRAKELAAKCEQLGKRPEDRPPYGEWCRNPDACRGKGYCPLDPTCGD
jgi:hypothetical protein